MIHKFMNMINVSKVLGGVVFLTGVVVMFGWIADIPVLTSILPQWVTMKFSTALSFTLSGIIIYLVACVCTSSKVSGIVQMILMSTSFLIILFMVAFLISSLMGVRTGIEDLFIKEAEDAVKSATHGRPSVGTMVSFMLIAFAGIAALIRLRNVYTALRLFGGVIFVLGIVAILGYIINMPVLYYYLEGLSTAMAFHTAILFVFAGTGLYISGKEYETNKFTDEL
ncbi:hypothetical protein ACFL6I_21575 [candidate division KSB1 bacterium]